MRQRMSVMLRGDTVRRVLPPGGNTLTSENRRCIVSEFVFTLWYCYSEFEKKRLNTPCGLVIQQQLQIKIPS